MEIKRLDGHSFYAAFKHGAELVERNRKKLNEINFFPVPDSDTGNNMSSTLVSAALRIKPENSIYQTFRDISDYTIQTARGNSGLILAQFFNGFFRKMVQKNVLTTAEFADNVRDTVPYLYENIDDPHEGTMLTVIKDWAEQLPELAEGIDDFVLLFELSLTTARRSLNRTRNQLKVHRENNSVDAGALGFVFFLEGIVSYWRSQFQDNRHYQESFHQFGDLDQDDLVSDFDTSELPEPGTASLQVSQDGEKLSYRYCTEVLLQKENSVSKSRLKELLQEKGDSLVLAESEEKIRIHIHSDHPEEVVFLAGEEGRIIEQKADDMRRQYDMAHNRMSDIALVTDSIADLPLEIKDRYQIHTIPLNLMIDGVNFYDKSTIDLNYFFKYLEEAKEFPTSSQPSLDLTTNYLRNLSSYYSAILLVSVSEKLSGTGQVFKQAARQIQQEKDIAVSYVDSRLNSGAQGLLVLKAAEEIARGRSLEEVTEIIEEHRSRAGIYVNVNTLDYMVRGGRVSPMKGLFARLLNLKPIVSLDEEGSGIIKDKVLSRRGVSKKIQKLAREINDSRGIEKYALVHSQAPELIPEWQRDIQDILGFQPEYVMEISAITALNAGPGSVALSLLSG